MKATKSPIALSKNVRYVVTEDSETQQHRNRDHWRWLLVLLVIGGSIIFGYVGLVTKFSGGIEIEAVEEEAVGEIIMLNVETETNGCNDYEVLVDKCSMLDIKEINAAGCEYYYELLTIDDENYASACYAVEGTDLCERNTGCKDIDVLHSHHPSLNFSKGGHSHHGHSHHPNVTHGSHRHNISGNTHNPNGVDAADYGDMTNDLTNVVDDCTDIGISEEGGYGCLGRYELDTSHDADISYVCHCMLEENSCVRNENCEVLMP